MSPQFCHLMNIFLISRLLFSFSDEPLTHKRVAFMTLLQLVGLSVYQPNLALAAMTILLIVFNSLFYFLERKGDRICELRLLSLLVYTVLFSVFFSPWINLDFNRGLLRALQGLEQYSLLMTLAGRIDWLESGTVLMGLLLVLNEANLLVRYLFRVFDLIPQKLDESSKEVVIDRREYNAGRVIGMLERALIYIAVLNNQFSAIGLIVAAKGFARFRQLEERRFAEYVLIGTLLSALLAVLAALAVMALLQ